MGYMVTVDYHSFRLLTWLELAIYEFVSFKIKYERLDLQKNLRAFSSQQNN